MKVYAVIGANFGDEGKGKMVDYLCSKHPNALVIRFNGGAQAGHTVKLKDGKRHVFHHFGSGTLRGHASHFAGPCIVNPLVFQKEYKELEQKGINPKLTVSFTCEVTCPYDMIFNVELNRANGHGSCGLGIRESVIRRNMAVANDSPSTLLFGHLANNAEIDKFLNYYRGIYLYERLEQTGLKPSDSFWHKIHSTTIADQFKEACKFIVDHTYIREPTSLIRNHFLMHTDPEVIIYEGAQGLLLDQRNKEFFPHLTPSNTGIRNVLDDTSWYHFDDAEFIYTSRAYTTRHGNGPFPWYVEGLLYPDDTNVHNEHQGTMRFGTLDTNALFEQINKDVSNEVLLDIPGKNIKPSIVTAITCMDQVDLETKERILSARGLETKYISYGPTAEETVEIK